MENFIQINIEKNIPFMEDIYKYYYNYVINILYPSTITNKNKIFIYTLSTLHIIGTHMISLGVLFPPKYQPLYLFYVMSILVSYKIFDNKCFITLLSNKYSNETKSPLYIKMSTANKLIFFHISLSIIAILFPKYSIYNLIRHLFR